MEKLEQIITFDFYKQLNISVLNNWIQSNSIGSTLIFSNLKQKQNRLKLYDELLPNFKIIDEKNIPNILKVVEHKCSYFLNNPDKFEEFLTFWGFFVGNTEELFEKIPNGNLVKLIYEFYEFTEQPHNLDKTDFHLKDLSKRIIEEINYTQQ